MANEPSKKAKTSKDAKDFTCSPGKDDHYSLAECQELVIAEKQLRSRVEKLNIESERSTGYSFEQNKALYRQMEAILKEKEFLYEHIRVSAKTGDKKKVIELSQLGFVNETNKTISLFDFVTKPCVTLQASKEMLSEKLQSEEVKRRVELADRIIKKSEDADDIITRSAMDSFKANSIQVIPWHSAKSTFSPDKSINKSVSQMSQTPPASLTDPLSRTDKQMSEPEKPTPKTKDSYAGFDEITDDDIKSLPTADQTSKPSSVFDRIGSMVSNLFSKSDTAAVKADVAENASPKNRR